MSATFLESEILINDQVKACNIWPRISDRSIVIYNFVLSDRNRIATSGPHTKLFFNQSEFVECFNDKTGGYSDLSKSGINIGYIEDCHGYAAADSGSHRRNIVYYSLKLYFADNYLDFLISGYTDYFSKNTAKWSTESDIKRAGKYDFSIWFRVPMCSLSCLFNDSMSNKLGIA